MRVYCEEERDEVGDGSRVKLQKHMQPVVICQDTDESSWIHGTSSEAQYQVSEFSLNLFGKKGIKQIPI